MVISVAIQVYVGYHEYITPDVGTTKHGIMSPCFVAPTSGVMHTSIWDGLRCGSNKTYRLPYKCACPFKYKLCTPVDTNSIEPSDCYFNPSVIMLTATFHIKKYIFKLLFLRALDFICALSINIRRKEERSWPLQALQLRRLCNGS